MMLASMLKPFGRFVILYMAWLPFEDRIAGKSERLVLTHSPSWSGCEAFGREHRQMLEAVAPEHFNVLHYAGMAILKNRK